MIYIASLPFLDAKSGKITYTPPSSYVAATGSAECQTGQSTLSSQKWRAFFSFNTASIPNHAQLEFVGFWIYLSKNQPFGMPQYYRLKFSIGTFIGGALDGTAEEFNAGTLMVTLESKPAHGTLLDLDEDGHGPEAYVNLSGETDVKVWDDSIQGSGNPSWGLDFNRKYQNCTLHIMYTVPAAKATGRGSASASATVVAAGSATATGIGTAVAAAVVTASGSSIATGRGLAQLIATVAATGSATVTGAGTADAAASVIASGASVATGRGSAQLIAVATAVAGATVTGRGEAEAAATVLSLAAATSTGSATAFCDAWVEGPTASADATGRGFASCHLTAVWFEPMARHFGTRAVTAAHDGVQPVPWVHSASRRCDPDDAWVRGPRRLH